MLEFEIIWQNWRSFTKMIKNIEAFWYISDILWAKSFYCVEFLHVKSTLQTTKYNFFFPLYFRTFGIHYWFNVSHTTRKYFQILVYQRITYSFLRILYFLRISNTVWHRIYIYIHIRNFLLTKNVMNHLWVVKCRTCMTKWYPIHKLK